MGSILLVFLFLLTYCIEYEMYCFLIYDWSVVDEEREREMKEFFGIAVEMMIAISALLFSIINDDGN